MWHDADADGIQDTGELGIEEVPVFLAIGASEHGPWEPLIDTFTDSGGGYSFDELAAGFYRVTFGQKAGYRYTDRWQGSDEAKDSDARDVVVSLGENENIDTIDGGYVLVAAGSLAANDDIYYVDIEAPDIQDHFFVLDNDSAEQGQIEVISVSSSVEGAYIESDGQLISYRMPDSPGTEISTGFALPAGDAPLSTGDVWTTSESGGYTFEDQFSYTIRDSVTGLTDDAFVQVRRKAGPPTWEKSLLPNFDEKDEIGIDEDAGYDLKIRQTFGKDTPNLRAAPGTQYWQSNKQSVLNFFIDDIGDYKQQLSKDQLILDVQNITAGNRTPVLVTDRLAIKTTADTDTSLLILQNNKRKAGLNAKGKLMTARNLPFKANAAETAAIEAWAPQGGEFLPEETNYYYINKTGVEAQHAAGAIDDAAYEEIKRLVNGLQSKTGHTYATIPGVFEFFEFVGERSWKTGGPAGGAAAGP